MIFKERNAAVGQKLVKDKAGVLYFHPPYHHGQPASPTITITAPGGGALASAVSGAAMTMDSVSTTLSADPSLGDDQVTLTSVSNINVGQQYVLETNSQRERVVVRSVDTSTKVVELADQIRIDHETGTTFKGCRLTYSLASGQQDSADRNYTALLKWNDEDGNTHYSNLVYHVVHHPWLLPTNEEDVLRSWPDAHMQDALRSVDLTALIGAASDEIVINYIRKKGYIEDRFFDMAPFVPLHIYLIRRIAVESYFAHDPGTMIDLATYWQDKADKAWEALLHKLPAYDEDNDGVVDPDSEEGIGAYAGEFLPRSVSTSNPDSIDSDDFHPNFAKIGIESGATKF